MRGNEINLIRLVFAMTADGKNRDKFSIDAQLQLLSWVDAKVYFVYSPALDITGYGISSREAEQSFQHVLKETFQYMVQKSALFDELERLGWLVNRPLRKVVAPNVNELKSENEELEMLSNRSDIKIIKRGIQLYLA